MGGGQLAIILFPAPFSDLTIQWVSQPAASPPVDEFKFLSSGPNVNWMVATDSLPWTGGLELEGSKIGPRLGENGLKIDIFWFVDFPLSGWRHLSKLAIYMIMIRLFLGIIGATHQSTPPEKKKTKRLVALFFFTW